MDKGDESELMRLTDTLRRLHDSSDHDALEVEALKKAALALSLGFIHGLRPEIEEHYTKLNSSLSDAERAQLEKLGIN